MGEMNGDFVVFSTGDLWRFKGDFVVFLMGEMNGDFVVFSMVIYGDLKVIL